MTYASLMVSVLLGRSNRHALQVTGSLAERFGSGVIGVGACRPIQAVCSDYSLPAKLFDEDRKQAAKELQAAEAEFRAALQHRTSRLEWRPGTTMSLLADHLAHEARSADLIVVGFDSKVTGFDTTRHVDICDLVMQAGRPVLVVPQAAADCKFDRVLIGWKDTREAQRAIADALPLLAKAAEVTVAGIAAKEELTAIRTQLSEVAGWLKHHGIDAQVVATASRGTHANDLGAIADELRADLVVAGAYGYRRQREWVLGGVTSVLLQRTDRCSFLSH